MPSTPTPRLALVDPLCRGLEHVPCNAALIATSLAAFPEATIDVYGEAVHLQKLSSLLWQTRPSLRQRITWIPIEIPERRATGWRRTREMQQCFARLDHAFRARPPDGLLVATTDIATVAILKIRLWLSWKVPTVAVMHEMLAVLVRRRVRSRRWWGLRATLSLPHPARLTYLVLSEVITQELDRIAPRLACQTIAIEHPSLLGDMAVQLTDAPPVRVRFGFVGGGRDAKGFRAFLHVAKAVRERHPSTEFEVVGSAPRAISEADLAGLTWSDKKLPLLDFVGRLRGLTHVIWLGDPRHYRLVASGSLADTLALGVPVLCLSGPYVRRLLGHIEGAGTPCDTIEEVVSKALDVVATFTPESYARRRDALRTASKALAPEVGAKRLRSALACQPAADKTEVRQ